MSRKRGVKVPSFEASPPPIAALRAKLLAWYAKDHRDLPWRRTSDAWRIWVSEIMLQQTRVETVIPYYERFVARYEDARALALAPIDAVLADWSGLGYYRRARQLHAAATDVVREHAGRFPSELDRARALPGIGRSTAGAIVSIAYGVRAPVLDGNVKRVLARLFALRGDPDAQPLEGELWLKAQEFVDCPRPGDVNQVLMELGATVCLPAAAARCGDCPVRSQCLAHAEGPAAVASLPEKKTKTRLVAETWLVAVAEQEGRRMLHQRANGGLLHGMWEFPTFQLPDGFGAGERDARLRLASDLRARFRAPFRIGDEIMVHRQVISNRKVTQRVFTVATGARTNDRARWLADDEIGRLGITTATRRILARLVGPVTTEGAATPPPARSRPRPR